MILGNRATECGGAVGNRGWDNSLARLGVRSLFGTGFQDRGVHCRNVLNVEERTQEKEKKKKRYASLHENESLDFDQLKKNWNFNVCAG